MTEFEGDLLSLLDEEIRVHRELLEIKALEKEALLAFSTAAVQETCERQNELTREIMQLEEKRREMTMRLGGRQIELEADPTLLEVAERLSPTVREECLHRRGELTELCDKIRMAQNINARIISRTGDYLHQFVENLLERAQRDNIAYDRGGQKTSTRDTAPGLINQTL